MGRNWITRGLTALALAGSGTTAWAGHGTQIDEPVSAGTCDLGATSCEGVNIGSSGLYRTAYLYREGIVSIDALLPATATSNDVASLGSGLWFAPGFSDGLLWDVSAYRRFGFDETPDAWGFNFWVAGTPQTDEDGFPWEPDMQVFLGSGTGFFADRTTDSGGWDGAQAAFGYLRSGLVADGALIGFGWNGVVQTVRNADGLLVGPNPSDTDFDSTADIAGPNGPTAPTRFTPLYATAPVPEPASWAMLIAGFAGVGAALRRRRTASSTALA